MKMAVLRGGKGEKNDRASLPMGGEMVQRKSLFGKFADSEMLSQLKGIALDPCNSGVSRDSIRPLWNQTLRVRKVLALGDVKFPRRKRKLLQFLKDRFRAAPGLASGVFNQQNVTKLSRGQLSHASSASCLLNSVDSTGSFGQKTLLNSRSSGSLLTFEDNSLQKKVSSEFFILDNAADCNLPDKDTSPLVDSDESVNCSNPSTLEDLTLRELPSLDLDDSANSSYSNFEESKQMNLQAPRRSIRLLNFIGDHLQRMAVPIGPRFQADVPDWTGAANGYLNYEGCDSESSRWLGTQVWPIEGLNVEITARAVGKGRANSCSCMSPRSTDCIKHHILEERILLQSDLGPAFLSWKFDEMGEEVSKSWTLKEQKMFESLAKTNVPLYRKNFLKRALRCLPSKCPKSISSYYLNVFIPRRMGLQTRSALKQVDIDDDKVEDVKNVELRDICKGEEGGFPLYKTDSRATTRLRVG